VFSFICYGVAGDAQRVQAAEENATETKGEEHGSASAFSDEDRQLLPRGVQETDRTHPYGMVVTGV